MVASSTVLSNQLSSSHYSNMVGHTAWGLGRESPILPPSLHSGEGSFPDLVPINDMVNSESVVDMKPGDSGVVIGYQVGDFIAPG